MRRLKVGEEAAVAVHVGSQAPALRFGQGGHVGEVVELDIVRGVEP
jgi:hypothetical protein